MHGEMNVSLSSEELLSIYRDRLFNAIIKNLVVVFLGISINYINASMVHTFHKEEVTTLLERSPEDLTNPPF